MGLRTEGRGLSKTLDVGLRENKELRKTQKQRDLENSRQRKTKKKTKEN